MQSYSCLTCWSTYNNCMGNGLFIDADELENELLVFYILLSPISATLYTEFHEAAIQISSISNNDPQFRIEMKE